MESRHHPSCDGVFPENNVCAYVTLYIYNIYIYYIYEPVELGTLAVKIPKHSNILKSYLFNERSHLKT